MKSDKGLIYVDEPVWPFRGQLYCHCWHSEDDRAALDAFIEGIGGKTSWRQLSKNPRIGEFYHFDLAPSMREKALLAGAVEIKFYDWIKQQKEKRESRDMRLEIDVDFDDTIHGTLYDVITGAKRHHVSSLSLYVVNDQIGKFCDEHGYNLIREVKDGIA